jgi:ABC-type uncharacterized transport system ATPase subunit
MGVVFGQRTQLWWDLPLEESFELVGHLYRIPRTDLAARLRRLEEVLALGPLLGVPVRSLSLGQRMRAELAAVVLPAPQVLFLDEPTIGLDVEAKAAVLVVDLTEDRPAEVAVAVLTRVEGRRRWYQFARDQVSAAELIARLLADHEVADLTLEEPDIEDIVRRIYRGESPP